MIAPLDDIEFEQRLCKMFSLVSLLYNKQLSPVALVLILVKDRLLRNVVCQYFDMSFFDLAKRLPYIYPVLYKSRKLGSVIRNNRLTLNTNNC